eukprot:5378051-Heterocapsa_arctica.AAC.1
MATDIGRPLGASVITVFATFIPGLLVLYYLARSRTGKSSAAQAGILSPDTYSRYPLIQWHQS